MDNPKKEEKNKRLSKLSFNIFKSKSS